MTLHARIGSAGYTEPSVSVDTGELARSGRTLLDSWTTAFADPPPVVPTDHWPPVPGAPLADPGKLPEIDASELSSQALRDGVLGSGSLIVRGLVDADRARGLTTVVDRALDARRRHRLREQDPALADWFTAYDPSHISFVTEDDMWVADSPVATRIVWELYRELGIPALMEDYLGEPSALSFQKWGLRRVPHDAQGGWHQDGNFMGADIRTMNMWLGLSDNGVTAPGLDLVPLRLPGIVQPGTDDAVYDWSVGQSVVDATCGDLAVVRPELKAGDAVFFDQLCLHRTGLSPAMTETRYAIESWFFSPSHFPSEYRGFYLGSSNL